VIEQKRAKVIERGQSLEVKMTVRSCLLLSGLVLLALAMVGPRLDVKTKGGSAQTEPARIVVHADESLSLASPLFFGQDFGPWGHGIGQRVAVELSDELLLPASASLRDDGRLAIIVINKNPTQERRATLTVEGFRPSGQAQVWLQDEEHLDAEPSAIAVAEVFPYTFLPYSVTLLILEPAPRIGWLLWVGLGLLIVALAVLAMLGYRVWRSR